MGIKLSFTDEVLTLDQFEILSDMDILTALEINNCDMRVPDDFVHVIVNLLQSLKSFSIRQRLNTELSFEMTKMMVNGPHFSVETLEVVGLDLSRHKPSLLAASVCNRRDVKLVDCNLTHIHVEKILEEIPPHDPEEAEVASWTRTMGWGLRKLTAARISEGTVGHCLRSLELNYVGRAPDQAMLELARQYVDIKIDYTAVEDPVQLKKEGNEAFGVGSNYVAVAKYTEALELTVEVGDKCVLLKNRAAANLRLDKLRPHNYEAVIADCTAVLEMGGQDSKALYRRCRAHHALGRAGQARADALQYLELNPTGTPDWMDIILKAN